MSLGPPFPVPLSGSCTQFHPDTLDDAQTQCQGAPTSAQTLRPSSLGLRSNGLWNAQHGLTLHSLEG